MSWWGILPVVAVQVALVIGPGWLILRLAGIRGLPALAGGAPVTLAFLSVAGIVLNALGVRWGWGALAAAIAPVLVAAALLGWWSWAEGSRGRDGDGPGAGSPLALGRTGLAVLVAAALLAIPIAQGMGHPDALLQQWDAVFHLNGAQLVRDTGNDALFGAMRPMSGIAAAHLYYPSVWHGVVALSPGSIPLAANATTFTFGVVVWLLGLASLGHAIAAHPSDQSHPSGQGRRARAWVPAGTVLLGGAFVAFPTGLMSERAQWPLGAATSLVPGALALLLTMARRLRVRTRRPAPARAVISVVVLLTAAGGVGLTHASAFFSLLLVAAPFVIGRASAMVLRWWDEGQRRRIVVTAVAVVLPVALAAIWIASSPRVHNMIAYRRDTRTPVPVSVASLLLDLPTTTGFPQVLALWPVTICVLVGAWSLRHDRGRRWLLWSGLLVTAMVALADGPSSPLQPLAGLWYTQAARIAAVFPVVAGPLAAYGVLRIAHTLRSARASGSARSARPAWAARLARSARSEWPAWPGRGWRTEAVATAVLAAMILVTAGWNAPTKRHFFVSSYVPGQTRWGHMLSADEIALLHRLPRTTPPDAVILGDPANGAAFAYAVAHRQVVFPQLTVAAATPDQRVLLERFDQLATDPGVCAAVRRLHVTYFYQDTAGPAQGAKTTPEAPGLQQPMTTGLQAVDHGGTATLYRITGCAE